MRVGYIVAVYNERPSSLSMTVDALLAQELRGPVVVVDDGSARPVELKRDGVQVIRQTNAGISVARNTGIARLHGVDFVATVNVDVLPPPSWARVLCCYLASHPHVGAAWSGLEHAQRSISAAWWLDCQEKANPVATGPTDFAPGHAVIFRREALDAVDGYNPAFRTIDEDHDVCRRMHAVNLETHGLPDPRVVSSQDVSAREMARKDVVRMKLNGTPRRVRIGAALIKCFRRMARHAVRGPRISVPRDIAVCASAIRLAVQTPER